MRISDWSSDVCSSDLLVVAMAAIAADVDDHVLVEFVAEVHRQTRDEGHRFRIVAIDVEHRRFEHLGQVSAVRSEERRVGKACVSTCRSRWSPSHSKKKK